MGTRAEDERMAREFLLPSVREIEGICGSGWVEPQSLKAKEAIIRLLGWDDEYPAMTGRAQDTEAIRAARERTPAEILATGAAWITESELSRLVARLEADEQALERIAANAESWHGYLPADESSPGAGHVRALAVIATWARAALAAAAPGETEQTP